MNILQFIQSQSELSMPVNWKIAKRKQYRAYICFVNKEYRMTNKLTKAQFTTKPNDFILCRPYGDIVPIPVTMLEYIYGVNNHVNECFKDQLNSLTGKPRKIKELNGEMVRAFNWQAVTSREDKIGQKYAAIQVPKKLTNITVQSATCTYVINATGVEHGKGDYLIAPAQENGQQIMVDYQRAEVINGRAFTEMFDMRAFSGQNIETTEDAFKMPEPLFTILDPELKPAVELLEAYGKKFGFKSVNISDSDKKRIESLKLDPDLQLPEDKTNKIYEPFKRAVNVDLRINNSVFIRVILWSPAEVVGLLRANQASIVKLVSNSNVMDIDNKGQDYFDIVTVFDACSEQMKKQQQQ